MEYRDLGTSGLRVSALCMGTWPLAGRMGALGKSDAVTLIRRAIDQGVTFVDTAEGYGVAEELTGKALGNGYRSKCIVATKVSSDFTADGVRRALDHSLEVLGTDYIDLYQIHRFDRSVRLDETLGAVADAVGAGKIRFVGVSNFTVSQLESARRITPIVSNQINYNALNRSPEMEMLPYCRNNMVALLAHSSLAKGLLSGKYRGGHTFAPDDERSRFAGYSGELLDRYLTLVAELREVAADHGLTSSQASLTWLLSHREVTSVLVGPKSAEQLDEAVPAASGPDEERRKSLKRAMNETIDRHGLPYLCPFEDQLV